MTHCTIRTFFYVCCSVLAVQYECLLYAERQAFGCACVVKSLSWHLWPLREQVCRCRVCRCRQCSETVASPPNRSDTRYRYSLISRAACERRQFGSPVGAPERRIRIARARRHWSSALWTICNGSETNVSYWRTRRSYPLTEEKCFGVNRSAAALCC